MISQLIYHIWKFESVATFVSSTYLTHICVCELNNRIQETEETLRADFNWTRFATFLSLNLYFEVFYNKQNVFHSVQLYIKVFWTRVLIVIDVKRLKWSVVKCGIPISCHRCASSFFLTWVCLPFHIYWPLSFDILICTLEYNVNHWN